VLLMGSGNVVHNLRAMDGRSPELGFDWVRPFSEEAIAVMTQRPAEAAQLVSHRDFSRVAPTPEHFLPLLYIAGARRADETFAIAVDGIDIGAVSMLSAVTRPANA